MSKFDLPSYLSYIRMSSKSHIMVEGPSDRQMLLLLIDEMACGIPDVALNERVDVDHAGMLKGLEDVGGNCEKVEAVSVNCAAPDFDGKYVGFVDRQFREFELGATILDNLQSHKVQGRTIWSKGHSIENYYFERDVLRGPLRMLCLSPFFADAVNSLEAVFESAIRMACAIGLATVYDDQEYTWQCLTTCIRCSMIQVGPAGVRLQTNEWEQSLIRDRRLKQKAAEGVVASYREWLSKLELVDRNTMKWLCHGHIGVRILKLVFARCLLIACGRNGDDDPARAVQRDFLYASEKQVHNAFAADWARQAVEGLQDYPHEVFRALGLA